MHVKFSDDDGRTWLPWGKGAALPGSQAAKWSNGTYGYPETVVSPYKEHVACFWRHKRQCGVMWSVYDGSGWSAPAEISAVPLGMAKSITLDDMDEYRSLAGFSVPPYAPNNFIPLVWSDSDEGTVKLLKVPIPLTLPKVHK